MKPHKANQTLAQDQGAQPQDGDPPAPKGPQVPQRPLLTGPPLKSPPSKPAPTNRAPKAAPPMQDPVPCAVQPPPGPPKGPAPAKACLPPGPPVGPKPLGWQGHVARQSGSGPMWIENGKPPGYKFLVGDLLANTTELQVHKEHERGCYFLWVVFRLGPQILF